MADIPFAVGLNKGNRAVIKLQFINGVVPLVYSHMCITKDGNRYAFRTEEDAKLAANYNDWKYIEDSK
jgi:hypothetical protein